MRVAVLTREYPPEVYGGAGVHVEFLVRELRRIVDVDVHAFGAPRRRAGVRAYRPPAELDRANAACAPSASTWRWRPRWVDADVLHSHTWYANIAGVLGRGDVRQAARAQRPFARAARGRGRPSSSAAATGSRPGPSGRPTRPPTRSSPSPTGCAPTCSTPTRSSIRRGCTSSTTASTRACTARRPPTRRAAPATASTRPPVGDLRRADHPAEGPGAPARAPRRRSTRRSS